MVVDGIKGLDFMFSPYATNYLIQAYKIHDHASLGLLFIEKVS